MKPVMRAWRRAWDTNPLTATCGLLLWAITAWWLIPAWSETPGSIITRILELSLPISSVRWCVGLLTVLLGLGLLGRKSWLTRTSAIFAFSWWTCVMYLVVAEEPTSTTTGSTGLVLVIAGIYLWGTTVRPKAGWP